MRLKSKYENLMIVKFLLMLVITMEFINKENLKTKVYKSKRNKKPYVKELKI